MNDVATISSRVAYENRWTRVREDRIRLRDGSESIYGVVEKANFVIVAPICKGMVHLVQQYRYPIGSRQWEFPQGSWEGCPDATPSDVARGELLEEAGIIAGNIVEAGQLYPLYGLTTHSYRVFLATDLTVGKPEREHSEQDMTSRAFSLAEFERMIVHGEIRDAGTVASFGLLRLKGLI